MVLCVLERRERMRVERESVLSDYERWLLTFTLLNPTHANKD